MTKEAVREYCINPQYKVGDWEVYRKRVELMERIQESLRDALRSGILQTPSIDQLCEYITERI